MCEVEKIVHPRHRLDSHLINPVRLSIMSIVAGADMVEFATVRDSIEVTNSVLSRQASGLEKAGYLKVIKGYVGKFPRTWFSLTPEGRDARNRRVSSGRDHS